LTGPKGVKVCQKYFKALKIALNNDWLKTQGVMPVKDKEYIGRGVKLIDAINNLSRRDSIKTEICSCLIAIIFKN